MIFFEGFGSLIPYLVYLSLIWACLLFGFRGQIIEMLHLPGSKIQVISPTSLKNTDAQIFQYYINYRQNIQPEKISNFSTRLKEYHFASEFKRNHFHFRYLDSNAAADNYNFSFQRGPPSINS